MAAEYGTDEPDVSEISGGQLPPGLSLNAATGEIAGVPTQAGTFDFNAKVTSVISADYRNFTMVVSDVAPAMDTASERLEAEDATLANGLVNNDARSSGGAFFSGTNNYQVAFNHVAAEVPFHELRFRVSSTSGYNSANVLVNGKPIGTIGTDAPAYTTLVLHHPLPVGSNTITIKGVTTSSKLNVDYLQIIESPVNKSTTVLNPIADAYVRGGTDSTNNYGNIVELRLQGDTGTSDRRAYLKFDLSSVSGTVSSAILRLKPKSTQGRAFLSVYSVQNDTWVESGIGGITYDTRPIEGPLADSNMSPIQGGWWLELDVTDLVLNEIEMGDHLLSTAILSDDDSEDVFHSRNASVAGDRPQLIITTK